MYKEKYLISLRVAVANDLTYLRGRVAAELKKQVVYVVDVKILPNKSISDVHCECKSGKGPSAYCKHVTVVYKLFLIS